jgi:hypothetical protein
MDGQAEGNRGELKTLSPESNLGSPQSNVASAPKVAYRNL